MTQVSVTVVEEIEAYDGAAEALHLDRDMQPQRARDSRKRELLPPREVVAAAVLASIIAITWSAVTHSLVLYGDARAHMNVARRVTDGLITGPTQLGSVWLPVPHLLLVPFVAIEWMWHSGAAGAIVGGSCFVYATSRMYTLAAELTKSRLAAWVAFLVMTLNLNLLYIQSTALTEPVLLAFLIGAVYHFARWMRTASLRDLFWSALLTSLATLTRYEGWALLLAIAVGVVLWTKRVDRRARASEAHLIFYGVIGAYGIVLWFLYNLIIFGDPLYFANSVYSAQAINGPQAEFGLLGTKGSIKESVLTYGWAVIGVVGPFVVIAAGVAIVITLWARVSDWPRQTLVLAVLAAPLGFDVFSLFAGQTTIRVPQRPPHAMWNDRYGLMALPLCAVALGLFASRGPKRAALAISVALAGMLAMGAGTPLTIRDGRTGISSAAAGLPERVAEYIHDNYRGGKVLADDSASSALIFATRFNLKEFVTNGAHPYFEEAIKSPSTNVAWALAVNGDAVAADINDHPERFKSFSLVFTDGRVRLFKRIAAAPAARATSSESPGG